MAAFAQQTAGGVQRTVSSTASVEEYGGDGSQKKRMAVVEFSTSYLRQKPDYESPLETQELMGTVVEIVGEQSYWREVVTPQPYRAWCTDQGLVEMSEEELEAYIEAPKVMFMELYGHIYKEPSFKAETICDLVGGDLMRLAGAETGKRETAIKLRGRWTKVMLPSGRTGYVPTNELKVHEGFMSIAQGEGSADSISDETMEAIIAEAEELIGVPYLWGGMTPKGVDCSGLVRWSFLMNGILLPRNASQMIHCGDEVPLSGSYRSFCIDCLQRGDLVFFGTPASEGAKQRVTHVGIYIGGGRIIHSSHMVRVNSLVPAEADYYENAHRLIAARRL